MKRKQRELTIGVSSPEEIAREAATVWKRAEKGLLPPRPIEGVYFADFATLFRVLTPRRFELLRALRGRGKMTVRALARCLKRDYKNVHTDVQMLKHAGLIESDNGRIFMPWKTIKAELTVKPARRAA